MDLSKIRNISEESTNLERWIVSILFLLVVLVGGIRLYPWLNAQRIALFPIQTHSTSTTSASAADTPSALDTELAPIITEQHVPLKESRSQRLTEFLSELNNAPDVSVIMKSEDDILVEDVAKPAVADKTEIIVPIPETVTIAPPPVTQTEQSSNTIQTTNTPPPPHAKPESSEKQLPIAATIPIPGRSTASSDLASSDPASIPAPQSVITKSPSIRNNMPDEAATQQIRASLQRWTKAWSEQSVEQYFQSYVADMTAPSYLSHRKWRAWRQDRLTRPKTISVEIDRLEVVLNTEAKDQATATFIQHYQTDTFSDKVIKTLRLVNVDGRWLISQEKSIATP